MRVAIACLRPFQKLPHLLELLQQPVDFLYGAPRSLRDPQPPRSREHRRIGPLVRRHGQHDRLDVLQAPVVGVDRLERLRVHSRQQAEYLFNRSHRLHLLQRDEKVREVHPLFRARLSLETLRRLSVHGGGRLLDQRHDVALAQDAARHAYRVEGFQLGRSMLRPYVFPDADVLDRHAGHAMNRERRPAPRVAVELSQDRAGQPYALLKPARDPHGVLPRHPIHHKQHLARARRRTQRLELVHQRRVDLQPAGRVDDDRAAPRLLRLPKRLLDQSEDGTAPRSALPRKDRHADLHAELLQLLASRGAREVRRHQSRGFLLDLQPPRQLRRGGGLPRALQPDQQDHRRPDGGEVESPFRPAQQCRDLVVHELHDLLAGAYRLYGQRADRPLAHPLHEPRRDLEADVGLEQVPPDLAQRLGHVLLRQYSPTGEALQSGGQPFGEGRKHKPTKLLSELPESKWGDQRTARVTRIVGTRFQPAQPAGASTSRTTCMLLTSSCLISDRLAVEPPDRRFAHARPSPCAKRAAAALSSHSVYHTSASPPFPPALLRPSTWYRSPSQPAAKRAAALSLPRCCCNRRRISNSPSPSS